MTYPTTDSAQYYVERYSKLIDGRIVGLAVDDADDEVFLGLRIRLPSGQILNAWISGDEEGNHPGVLDLEEDK